MKTNSSPGKSKRKEPKTGLEYANGPKKSNCGLFTKRTTSDSTERGFRDLASRICESFS